MSPLETQAHEIADQYLAQLPPTYEGRYSEIASPETVQTLLEAIHAGLTHQAACEAAGISHTTFNRWLDRAKTDPQSAFGAFEAALKREKRQGQIELLNRLKKHGEKQWLPNAWLLERTDQAQFALQHKDDAGPKVIVQIGIKDSDVHVSLTPVNGITNYQTQTESESVSLQVLTAPGNGANGAKV